jgi:hypothetical protein
VGETVFHNELNTKALLRISMMPIGKPPLARSVAPQGQTTPCRVCGPQDFKKLRNQEACNRIVRRSTERQATLLVWIPYPGSNVC